jgi:SAM-dependent methyltransferase
VPWWQAAFSADYLTVYSHRDEAAADAEIAGLFPVLGTGPVLDACCGNGRHLAALRRRGVRAVGFDFSSDLLRATRAPCAVARGDVRDIPFSGGFSAVLVLFTAFGYFDKAGNTATLAGLGRQLGPGGRLVIDLPDPQRVRATLVPHSEREVNGLHISERRYLSTHAVHKDVVIRRADGSERRYTESVRLYETSEMADLAAASGMHVADRWRSLRGSDCDEGRLVWFLSAEPKARE